MAETAQQRDAREAEDRRIRAANAAAGYPDPNFMFEFMDLPAPIGKGSGPVESSGSRESRIKDLPAPIKDATIKRPLPSPVWTNSLGSQDSRYFDPHDPDAPGGTHQGTGGEQDEGGAGPPPNPAAPVTPERQRELDILEHVRQMYRDILGREPTQGELAQGATTYTNQGGEALRANLTNGTPGGLMTLETIQARMRAAGISEGVIADEARNYVGATAADAEAMLSRSMSSYMARTQSGGDRDAGGYNTNWADDDPRRFSGEGPGNGQPGSGGNNGGAYTNSGGYAGGNSGGNFMSQFGNFRPYDKEFSPTPLPDDLMDRWDRTFVAPDASKIGEDPLVQSRIRLGQNAIQRGAASHGTLLTPGVQQGIAGWAGDVASEEYGNIWGRARSEFGDAYEMFEGDRSRRQGVAGDTFNRELGTFGTNYQVNLDNQTIPFGWAVQGRQLSQGDRSLSQGDRRLSQGDRSLDMQDQDAQFNRNRMGYLDDFNMWHTLESDWYDRQFRTAAQGRPN